MPTLGSILAILFCMYATVAYAFYAAITFFGYARTWLERLVCLAVGLGVGGLWWLLLSYYSIEVKVITT
jgi:hypothetical protein